MPRKAKRTLSGAQASPPRPAVGVPYGEGERRLEAQRRTPVPVAARPGAGPAGSSRPAGGEAAGGTADRFAQALQALQGMQPPASALSTPSARPNEDITAGMAGAPDQLAPMPVVNDALYELRALAQRFGYRDFLDFLERIQRGS